VVLRGDEAIGRGWWLGVVDSWVVMVAGSGSGSRRRCGSVLEERLFGRALMWMLFAVKPVVQPLADAEVAGAPAVQEAKPVTAESAADEDSEDDLEITAEKPECVTHEVVGCAQHAHVPRATAT
jgi:hypothetical protein